MEVSGETRKDKEAKVSTVPNLRISAGNSQGASGRWEFIEMFGL
jgi:hypothetical protein